eukprot:gene2811-2853_t
MSGFTPHPAPAALSTANDRPAFLFVKIPVTRHTMDPLHLREDRIDQALRAQGTGMVIGWGDSLGAARKDGKRIAEFIRIDISAPVLDPALVVLRALLPELDTPMGTQIHYTLNGQHRMDRTTETGWQLALPPPSSNQHGRR